ncbi:MAG: M48 family metallopeptidase [Spirochaetales bacterium]|jgi:predicted metal-dependent hydrolase|nr:M48 family metallopeptidase [Spirochaetales bacterium]
MSKNSVVTGDKTGGDIENPPVAYQLIRRKRQKHINIRVHHNGEVTVSAPVRTSMENIRRAVKAKEKWIRGHIERVLERMNGVDELAILPINGQQFTVNVVWEPDKKGRLEVDQPGRTIVLQSPDNVVSRQKQYFAACLKRYSKQEISPLVRSLAKEWNVEINRIYFRDQRTRWGSSSARGNISLNWRILFLPDEIRRYLILHELTHQMHMNHSREFWHTLEERCRDCRGLDRRLKEYSYLLGLFSKSDG